MRYGRTITQVRAARARSFSVVARAPTQARLLQDLPSELILSIIELALLNAKPHVLATISKGLHLLVNRVLYRTIILASPLAIQCLHRTATMAPHLLLQVKKLVMTWDRQESCKTERQLGGIIATSTNLHYLTLPAFASVPALTNHHQLTEITSPASIDGEIADRFKPRANTITRLRFTEPNEYHWLSPRDTLTRLGNPPNVTHLQFSRRTGANEGNDIAFANDLACLLSALTKLQMLVVSIFSGYSWEAPNDSAIEDSHIWKIILDLKASDERVFLIEGVRDGWKKEYDYFQPADPLDSRFWVDVLCL